MLSAKSRWVDAETWACLRHAPSLVLPTSQKRCWLCKNLRPELTCKPVKTEESSKPLKKEENSKPEVITCDLEDCLNSPVSGSKYCSRNCSNKNARKRYNRRKNKNLEIK